MDSLAALDSDQIKKVSIGAIIAVVVIGALLALVISAIIGRLIILVVVVVLGAVIWAQRSTIEDDVKHCHLHMSFFGYHIDAPHDVVRHCREIHKGSQGSLGSLGSPDKP